MKAQIKPSLRLACHSFGVVCAVALVLQFGVLASSAQTGIYLFTGSETTITLNPGTYDITAYGAQGGGGSRQGGLGAEMDGEFTFSGLTTLTLLVAVAVAPAPGAAAAAAAAASLSMAAHRWSSQAAAAARGYGKRSAPA